MVPRETPHEPTPAEAAEAPHDPTGLDVAQAFGSVARGGPRRAPRPRRRRVDPQFSSAHPDDRDPQLIDSTLGRLMSERGWSRSVAVHSVVGRWNEVVGPDVASHCQPESYDEEARKLVIRADSTAWATQMRLLAPTVIRRMAEVVGDGLVLVIDVQGPTAPSWTKGRRTVRGGRGPRDTYG